MIHSATDRNFFIAHPPQTLPLPLLNLRLTGCVNSKNLNDCSQDLLASRIRQRLECRWPVLVFFEGFEFDRRAKVLSRAGQPLVLTAQSLELLDILLEAPGELVSREMIQQRLWPGSNVEFEHSLDVLVSRLRATLGDKSKSPRFIQTIPRKGYRFIGQVSFERNPRNGITIGLPGKLAISIAIVVLSIITGVVIAHTRYPTPRAAPATTLSPH